LSNLEWNQSNVDKLLACVTTEDFMAAFPGRNVETLKRRQRSIRNGDFTPNEDVPDADGSITLVGDSGTINTGTVEQPITDWTDTLQIWGLDPEQFEVVEPVAMKAWDSGTGRKFSYAAKVRKITKSEDIESKLDIAGWRENLKRSGLSLYNRSRFDNGTSYLMLVADPQLGKPGTKDALGNWTKGIEGHVARIRNLIAVGVPINDIALAFMGDEHEGCVGNYASQPYEVEMDYTSQIELDFDMRVWSIRQLLALNLPIAVSSVPSNHGEHTRFGGHQALTSIYDNSSTMVASLAKKVFEGTTAEEFLTWHIAKNRQDVNLELSGVKANFTHGHVSKGSGTPTGGMRSKSALERQILGRRDELTHTDLFFTAHYHHFNVIEDRGRTFFGCPALEAEKSSQWFFDSSGAWSRPGMLGMLVGKACGARSWDELAVI
jgi:hypothetical protein